MASAILKGLVTNDNKKNFLLNSRKSQWTSQKYRNLVGSDQQMQRLEETELRKADRKVGFNCYIFSNISSGIFLQGMSFMSFLSYKHSLKKKFWKIYANDGIDRYSWNRALKAGFH